LTVELLAAAVFLDCHVRDFIDALVGGESPLTGKALAPAAYGVAFLAFPGIHHPVM
jgi:hypothetical protein